MSEISSILAKLNGTTEFDVLTQMESAYENIAEKQAVWYKNAKFFCIEGCGECCRNFDPDLLDCEALYMAAWILENKPELAEKVAQGEFPFPERKGCPFWDEDNPYHCMVYGGRACICRLFGATSNHSKNNEIVYKPCKFYPIEKLQEYNPKLLHKQFNLQEIQEIFGTVPPVMNDLMENVVSINPDNHETELLRNILPGAIRKLMWICSMNSN